MVNERLRQAILDADLSLEDLAGEIGIDPNTAEQLGHQGPGLQAALQALDDCRRGPLRVNPGPAEIGVSRAFFPRRGGPRLPR